ncbi:MAG: hypothetical protein ACXACI_03445 [Candidatus Hodarchaeales archaeon]|jgi:hypothetical protein
MPTKKRNQQEKEEIPPLRHETDLEDIRRLVSLVGGTLDDEEDTEFLLAGFGLPKEERQVVIRHLYS